MNFYLYFNCVKEIVKSLKELNEVSEHAWFFVNSSYRILAFNKTAFNNSKLLHDQELGIGDSILDYARDTTNKIDQDFITCLGRACEGQTVKQEKRIEYNSSSLNTISTYTPIYNLTKLVGVSITVQVIDLNMTDHQAK